MFSDISKARSNFGHILHLNTYVLCAINMDSVDEFMLLYQMLKNMVYVEFPRVLRSENY